MELINYDFKKKLKAYAYKESFDSIFRELHTIYRHQKGAGSSSMAVTEKNMNTVKNEIEEGNKATYVVIEHQLKFGSSAIRTIIPCYLHLIKSG